MALNISQNIKNIRNKYVTDAEQIKGGYGVVATVADLANLPSATIVEGSLYYCQADDKLYKYNGSAWVEFSVGGQEYTAGSGLLLNNHQFSVDTSTIATQANLTAGLANKQDTLVSGQNIKTINNNSIVGSGNLNIAPGTPMVFSDEEVEGGTSLRSITIDDEAWNIAAGGSTYTAGSNIQISDQNVISATDTVYTAGTGLNLVANQFGVDTDTIATKTYVDGKVTSLYKYKGSCVYADLPTSGQVTGDVWNVTDKHGSVPAGTNYAWDGSAWDPLGGSVDLSAYRTAANQDIIDATFATNTALQQGLATKITTGAISASTSEVAGASEAKSITIEGTSYNVGGSAAATWGSITGTLSNQTDLQTELDTKGPAAVKVGSLSALNSSTYPNKTLGFVGTSTEATDRTGFPYSDDARRAGQVKNIIVTTTYASEARLSYYPISSDGTINETRRDFPLELFRSDSSTSLSSQFLGSRFVGYDETTYGWYIIGRCLDTTKTSSNDVDCIYYCGKIAAPSTTFSDWTKIDFPNTMYSDSRMAYYMNQGLMPYFKQIKTSTTTYFIAGTWVSEDLVNWVNHGSDYAMTGSYNEIPNISDLSKVSNGNFREHPHITYDENIDKIMILSCINYSWFYFYTSDFNTYTDINPQKSIPSESRFGEYSINYSNGVIICQTRVVDSYTYNYFIFINSIVNNQVTIKEYQWYEFDPEQTMNVNKAWDMHIVHKSGYLFVTFYAYSYNGTKPFEGPRLIGFTFNETSKRIIPTEMSAFISTNNPSDNLARNEWDYLTEIKGDSYDYVLIYKGDSTRRCIRSKDLSMIGGFANIYLKNSATSSNKVEIDVSDLSGIVKTTEYFKASNLSNSATSYMLKNGFYACNSDNLSENYIRYGNNRIDKNVNGVNYQIDLPTASGTLYVSSATSELSCGHLYAGVRGTTAGQITLYGGSGAGNRTHIFPDNSNSGTYNIYLPAVSGNLATITANPTAATTETLSSIEINGTNYAVGGSASSDIFWCTTNVTTGEQIADALTNNKVPTLKYSNRIYTYSYKDSSFYYFYCVFNTTTYVMKVTVSGATWTSDVINLQDSLDAKANLSGATFSGNISAPNLHDIVYSESEPATPTTGMIWLEPVE